MEPNDCTLEIFPNSFCVIETLISHFTHNARTAHCLRGNFGQFCDMICLCIQTVLMHVVITFAQVETLTTPKSIKITYLSVKVWNMHTCVCVHGRVCVCVCTGALYATSTQLECVCAIEWGEYLPCRHTSLKYLLNGFARIQAAWLTVCTPLPCSEWVNFNSFNCSRLIHFKQLRQNKRHTNPQIPIFSPMVIKAVAYFRTWPTWRMQITPRVKSHRRLIHCPFNAAHS